MLPLIFAALFAQQWQGDFLLPSPRFHAIGLVSEEPVKGQPGEKFQALRLNYKVVTQGCQCHWAGVVRDARARTLLRVDDQRLLPKGEALLLIEVPGGEIEAFAADGPLVLANMQVDCGDPILSEGFMDPRHYITGTIHAKDYRHVNPDFELTPSQPRFSGHVGDAVRITMAKKYLGAWNQLIEMHLEDLPTGVIPSSVSTGWDGFEPRIARSAAPGVYTVRAVAKSGSLEHSIAFELEILPPREPLFPADGSEPATPSAASIRAGTAVQKVLDVGAAFRAEVDLRPMNVVLVVQHGGSLAGPRCDAMKQLATYFVQQFVEGRDNVGVVGFNDGVFIVDPIREDFKTGPANTLSRIAALRCEGSGGVHAYALEVAYQQLRARSAPAALNMIVMLAAAPPSKIAAEWPVRTKADRRYVVNETQESQYRTPDQEVTSRRAPAPTRQVGAHHSLPRGREPGFGNQTETFRLCFQSATIAPCPNHMRGSTRSAGISLIYPTLTSWASHFQERSNWSAFSRALMPAAYGPTRITTCVAPR
jgi:hypothetical protein